MLNNIKVSVVIPIYNVEKYLEECLDSVINQTLKDIEIICVNDGSTDHSLDILKKYQNKDNRIIIIDKENAGYGHSINQGIKAAKGEYVAILESDDYIKNTMYERLYETAQKYNDADFIKSNHIKFWGSGTNRTYKNIKVATNQKYYNVILNPEDEKIVFRFDVHIWTGIYKRAFLINNNIFCNESPGASYQDNGFWFQTMIYASKILFLDEAFYYYRQDNENSSIHSKGKVDAIINEYKYILNILDLIPEKKEKFIDVFVFKKYMSYKFTLTRIDECFVKDFLKVFAEEFRVHKENKELIEELYDDSGWKLIQTITDDPEKAYLQYRIDVQKKEIENLKIEYKLITNSLSFRIGRKVTGPFRAIRDILKK